MRATQMFYYKKALAENTKDGIKYETVMTDLLESYRITMDKELMDNNETNINIDYGI